MKDAKLILVVDDDQDEHQFFKEAARFLTSDVEIVSTFSGVDALRHLHACLDHNLPDLLVVDYNMPFINGLEFVHVVRRYSRYVSIPIIMWSTCPTIAEECTRNGVTKCFTKPSSMKEIIAMTKEIMEQL